MNNIVFEENNKKFQGHYRSLGIAGSTALQGLSVFPNPATDFVNVSGLDAISGIKTIVLSSVAGVQISRHVTSQVTAQISTVGLPAGNYILQVITGEGSAAFCIVK